MEQYPTKEEILNKKHTVKELDIAILTNWKEHFYKKNWKNADKMTKQILLATMLGMFNQVYKKQVILNEVKTGLYYHYIPNSLTIVIDRMHPSILSTLHEYAHHLLGPSELEACVWSIRLFEKVFPKEFTRLQWKGHMLKLANQSKNKLA